MARILFLSNIPTPYQIDFLDQLALGNEIQAFFLWQSEANRDWQLAPRSYLQISHQRGWFATAWTLLSLLRTFRPDAVLIGGYKLPHAEWLKWVSMCMGAKVAYWLEKPLPQSRPMAILRRWVWRLRLSTVYGVAAIGRDAEKIYAPYCRRTLNLPYSIDTSRYSSSEPLKDNAPVRFLFVGQLIPRKGIAELLAAFAHVAPTDAVLTIAGSGDLLPLVQDYAARFTHIKTLGFIGPDLLPDLYSSQQVLLVPSRHDGWAVVVCEAMAAGMPVIGTAETGAFSEFIRHGQNGFECQVTEDDLYHWINIYCQNRHLVEQHGLSSRDLLNNSPANSVRAAQALLTWFAVGHKKG